MPCIFFINHASMDGAVQMHFDSSGKGACFPADNSKCYIKSSCKPTIKLPLQSRLL